MKFEKLSELSLRLTIAMSTKHHSSCNVYLNPAPNELQNEFKTLFTADAVQFLVHLNLEFQSKIDALYTARYLRKYDLIKTPRVPKFLKTEVVDQDWKVAPVCE